MRYTVQCNSHATRDVKQLWAGVINVDNRNNDCLAKIYATNQHHFIVGEKLSGLWERKQWGWVRWHKSLCVMIKRQSEGGLTDDGSTGD